MSSVDFVETQDRSSEELLSPLPVSAHSAGAVADAREHVKDIVFNPTPGRRLRGKRRAELVPVVLIDRSALCRAGLRHILGGTRFRINAEHDQLSQIRSDLLANRQCVVLVGLDQDVEATFARFRLLKSANPNLRIVALSNRMDPEQLVAAFDSGANGYLMHDEIAPETVLRALELVLVDGMVVPRGFTKLLGGSTQWPLTVVTPASAAPPSVPVDAPIQVATAPASSIIVEVPPELDPCFARLSDREQLILEHLTRGASNKRIARDLNIAEATVKAHIKSLLRKLRVSNRTQAAMWAIDHVRRDEPKPEQPALEP